MHTVKILDRTGHTELVLEQSDVLDTIHDNTQNGEWVFIDGQFIELGEISGENLGETSEIVITPALQAG